MLKKTRMKSTMVLLLSLMLLLAPTVGAYGQAGSFDKVQDNELVINTLDDQGNITGIKVLSHLRAFGEGSAVIEDGSAYKISSVRNLYGKEKIETADGKLKVNVNIPAGENYQDVYYLATLDQAAVEQMKMPVSVKVKYFLDGSEMPASALAGKTGHLKITCELENLTGAKQILEFKDKNGEMVKTEAMVYTPYAVSLSGWEFNNNNYSNIQAPGVAGQSPQGVIVDAQGISMVSWTVPLVPPKYPAKQFTTLEADAKNISLNSFKIAIMPIVPTTSEIDSLGKVQDSMGQLYDAFDTIEGGVGAPGKDATLLFGLTSVKDGVQQLSGGVASLIDNLKKIRLGLSNPLFDAASYDTEKGTDANGNKPGVQEAVTLSKKAMDTQLIPAFEGQKQVL
ncbi:MAG: hypothetical protein U9N81_07845, partial [Bacillota bacterium]|nr:hypothetical protein [Bacillota bacterium]